MKIQTKLNALFALLILLALMLAGQTLRVGAQLGRAIEQSRSCTKRRVYLEQVRARFTRIDGGIAQNVQETRAARRILRTLLAEPVDPQEPAIVEQLLRDIEALEQGAATSQLPEHLNDLGERYEAAVHRAFSRLQSSTRWAAILVFSLLFVALAQVLIMSIGVRCWLVTPLARVADAMQQISRGDLGHRLGEAGSGEMAELARNINRMAASLAGYQQRLIESERLAALGEMSAYVAHAVRNPLASIRSAAQVGSNEPDCSEELRQSFTDIISTADRLANWAQDLLTSIGPLRLKPGAVEIGAWLLHVRSMLEPAAGRRGLAIEVAVEPETPRAIEGDESLLVQALAAVVENAIEACPPPGPIRIVASPARAQTPGPGAVALWVDVIDRGPGIPPELRQRVLRPYFTTKSRGTGIGLAMAQRILVLHGGRVEILDPPAAPGCTVRLAVPPAPPPADEARTPGSGRSRLDGGRSGNQNGIPSPHSRPGPR